MRHYGDICKMNGEEKKYLVYKLIFPNGKCYIGMTSKTV